VSQVEFIVDGVQCPKCNGESRVIDSRDGETSRRRRRECLSCKHRYSTYEIHAAEYDRLQVLKIDLGQINAAITTLRAIKLQFEGSNGHHDNKD
jgi:transcriptional regulator NrdR family protein